MPRTFTQLYYHIVWATKLRYPYVDPELREGLYPLIGGAVRDRGGVLLSIGGMPEHIHVLASLRAHPSVAQVVKAVKGGTSNWVNDHWRTKEHFGWQDGYAAFSVSHSALSRVRRYIENQEEHHRRMTFREEMIKLCQSHGVDFRAEDFGF